MAENPIVSKIEKMVGTDGDVYVTHFDGKKLTYSQKEEPNWKVGETLPFKLKVVKPPEGQKGSWYYARAESPPQPQKESKSERYTASPEKIESIEYQNSRNIATQIYCHITEPGTPFDEALLLKIYKACNSLGKNPIVIEAKEKYGAVETD